MMFSALGYSRRMVLAVLLSSGWLALAGQGSARAEWPERQVTILVCFAPGGGTDIAVRMVANQLSQALGKPVTVENRPGASGNVAIAAVARATPDGYTLLSCSSAFVVNPSLYEQAKYDPLNDFSPIFVFGAAPNIFVVPGSSDIKTFEDFLRKAKSTAGTLNWTTPGQGTTPYMVGELLQMRLGIKLTHIPFAGAGPATQATLAGQVDMMGANLGSVGALLASGQLRAIAQTGKERWPDLREVPTLNDLGIKDAESDTFQGLLAPAGTPPPVVERLARELQAILAQPDIQERYWKSGLQVLAEGPEVFRARIAREVPFYKEIIDRVGLKIK
jgi:tripartite-type tricarboxylate transporter receptor subunit TctC